LSLTKFISLPDVKERFIVDFPFPSAALFGRMVAPPVTKNYALIGTAFDYLMRFYLERLNPGCITQPWVAEQSVELTTPKPKLHKALNSLLKFARESHAAYLKTGRLEDDILTSTIFLAQLDIIYRAGMLDPGTGKADPGDLEDLRNLVGAIKPDLFKSKSVCMLNPTFGEGSMLVGGADADIVIDNVLVDIKTSKYLEFTREQFNQIVGYYILNRVSGRVGAVEGMKFTKLGIYYSRYGILHLVPIEVIENNPKLKEFIEWFVKRAKEVYPQNQED
jgi:hypothetical protein